MIYLSDKSKMVLKLVGLFLVAGAIGFALFTLFFLKKPSVTPPPSTGGTGSTNGLPSAGEATGSTGGTTPTPGTGGTTLPSSPVANGGTTSTTVLTTTAVSSPTISSNGRVAYYNPGDGHFYTIDKNGNATLLSSADFPDAESVTFSSGATEAVIEFPDGSNVTYNFSTGQQSTLPSHWEEFSFSSDGTELATKSITTDSSARALVISSADGSSATAIDALGDNADAVTVNWSPDGSIVGFSATGGGADSFGQNSVYPITATGEDAGVLIVNGSNFTALWSPDSNHLLYSVADASADYKATLWYADKDGDRKTETRKEIDLQTSVDKCVFASASAAYCAVPTIMPAGGGTSSSLITAPDNLYKISFPALTTTLIASPAVETQMSNLQIDSTGSILYYTDASGRLNYLRLK